MTLDELIAYYGFSEFSIDILMNNENSFVIDRFPLKINNLEKYNSVKIFYQRVFDKTLSIKEFEYHEKKLYVILETLWLYNSVCCQVYFDSDKIKESYYGKRNRSVVAKCQDFFSSSENDNVALVKTARNLKALLSLGTREISPLCFFFLDFNLIVYVFDCTAFIYFNDLTKYQLVKGIVDSEGLFLRSIE